MDILYTLGSQSRWNDNELRYSLRSIEKYGRNVGRVFIAGPYRPGWLSGEVEHIYCADRFEVKARNIMLAITTAVETGALSDDFLLSSDDHFYTRPTDFDRYPYYYKGELPVTPFTEADGDGWMYHEQLFETAMLLKRYGLTTHNFAQHCNTHFNCSVFLAHREMMERSLMLAQGGEATCLMLNAMLADRPFMWEKRTDVKLTDIANHRDLLYQANAGHCFSIADRAISQGVAMLLAERFPKKSKYEI